MIINIIYTCLIIMALFVVAGAVITGNPILEQYASIIGIIYIIPVLLVMIDVAIVLTPFSIIGSLFKRKED